MKHENYFNWFFRLKCGADVLAKWGKTPSKEVTEVLAALRQLLYYKDKFDKRVVVFDIGCGCVPRFAILGAHMTPWDYIAIDPQLRVKNYHTKRLQLIQKKVENVNIRELATGYDIAIGVYVHSHGSEKYFMNNLTDMDRVVITIPCCYDCDIHNTMGKYFYDTSIMSPKNKVYVFEKRRGTYEKEEQRQG